jgi:hypothetical protein
MLYQITVTLLKGLSLPFKLLLNRTLSKAIIRAKTITNSKKIIQQVDTPHGRKIAMTLEVPRDLELDFLNYRSETYLPPMTTGVAEELALMLHKRNHPKVANLDILMQMFLSSSGALMTRWSDSEDCYVTSFEVMKAPLWKGHVFDITHFKFSPKRDFYCAIDKSGNSYDSQHANWQSIINHLVYQYTIAIPMASHNWVHFAYPDSFSAAVFRKLSRDSVLYKLLYPHTRFTNRINYQAVYTQLSTDNTPSLKNRLTPWKCFPLYGEDFRQGILENTSNHYVDMKHHFSFPESMDTRIPYFDFLKRYYLVIEKFVSQVAPHIDQQDYQKVAAYMEERLPGFQYADLVKSLSLLIWQVSVLHTVEHMSYYQLAMEYGFSDLQSPLPNTFSIDEVPRYNRFKLRSFLKVFGRFNSNNILDQRLDNYKSYQFEPDSTLENAARQFAEALKTLDNDLHQEKNDILPLDEIVQSVCF